MKLSNSLLYLLLLYCVVDKDNKVSTTTAIAVASIILLVTCYCGTLCPGATTTQSTFTNPFATINTL